VSTPEHVTDSLGRPITALGGTELYKMAGTVRANFNDQRSALNASSRITALLLGTTIVAACGGHPPPKNDDGSYNIWGPEVTTDVAVEAGQAVRVRATGEVDFGGGVGPLHFGAVKLGPDGDSQPTPDDFPVTSARKNSLVCGVGGSWQQCGSDTTIFAPKAGAVVLRANDLVVEDNGGSWRVELLPGEISNVRTFPVLHLVDTGWTLKPGSLITVTASGIINFNTLGSLAFSPDGEAAPAPADYPAPGLPKHSLICRIGPAGSWLACGRDGVITVTSTDVGTLQMQPNDSAPDDNWLSWQVRLELTDQQADPQATRFWTNLGPIATSEYRTGINIVAGSRVATRTDGEVDFGGALAGGFPPILDADGDDETPPQSYPAPGLKKNSLICRVAARWYQCGKDRAFVPVDSGELLLQPNDDQLADNSRGWTATVFVTPPPAPIDGAQPPISFGPLPVQRDVVDTGLTVEPGEPVDIYGAGTIDFGGAVLGWIGRTILDPDGSTKLAPANYPAPSLRENSLICWIGDIAHQCGRTAKLSDHNGGRIRLQANDPLVDDNTRGWTVTVTTRRSERSDQP
jgi:hypothetical protein